SGITALTVLHETVEDWAHPDEHRLVTKLIEAVTDQLQANRSEKIVISGAANLSKPNEFSGSLHTVLEAIEEQVTLLRLFGELVQDEREVAASIGRENAPYGLQDASVIASSYESDGDTSSRLGVLGPLRMDYAGNMAAVRAVARYLNRLLDENH